MPFRPIFNLSIFISHCGRGPAGTASSSNSTSSPAWKIALVRKFINFCCTLRKLAEACYFVPPSSQLPTRPKLTSICETLPHPVSSDTWWVGVGRDVSCHASAPDFNPPSPERAYGRDVVSALIPKVQPSKQLWNC